MHDHNSKYAACPAADPDIQHSCPVTLALALVEAAEVLAATRLVERIEVCCQECFRSGLHGGPIGHAASCCVGQTLMAAKLLREALTVTDAPIGAAKSRTFHALPAATQCPMPVEAEIAAWRERVPGGVLSSARTQAAESSYVGDGPVRKIVYEIGGIDGLCDQASESVREATHEEAAALHGGIFAEAAE